MKLIHKKLGEGTFIKREENRFYFTFGNRETYLTITEKFNLENILSADEELLEMIKEAIGTHTEPLVTPPNVPKPTPPLPLPTPPYEFCKSFMVRDIEKFKKTFTSYFKDAFKKTFSFLAKGKITTGYSQATMVTAATTIRVEEPCRRSGILMSELGFRDMVAWFAVFDRQWRMSGDDGYYSDNFKNEDLIIESCQIDDLVSYERSRTNCPSIRFVFKQDPYRTGNKYQCEFMGIFYTESLTVYKLPSTGRTPKYYGETRLKRFYELEWLLSR